MLNGSPEMGGLVIRVPRAAIRAKKKTQHQQILYN
jgi:hypothetical protein